jgi:hypothetical protein
MHTSKSVVTPPRGCAHCTLRPNRAPGAIVIRWVASVPVGLKLKQSIKVKEIGGQVVPRHDSAS